MTIFFHTKPRKDVYIYIYTQLMPFLLIPKFLPVLSCTGLFRHSWTVSPQAPQPQGYWDFKDDINDKTLGGTHHQQELVGGSVGPFQLFNSHTPNLHPGHAASRDIQQRQTNKIQPNKNILTSSHPHILTCLVEHPELHEPNVSFSSRFRQNLTINAEPPVVHEVEFTTETSNFRGFSGCLFRVLYLSKAFTWLEL